MSLPRRQRLLTPSHPYFKTFPSKHPAATEACTHYPLTKRYPRSPGGGARSAHRRTGGGRERLGAERSREKGREWETEKESESEEKWGRRFGQINKNGTAGRKLGRAERFKDVPPLYENNVKFAHIWATYRRKG